MALCKYGLVFFFHVETTLVYVFIFHVFYGDNIWLHLLRLLRSARFHHELGAIKPTGPNMS